MNKSNNRYVVRVRAPLVPSVFEEALRDVSAPSGVATLRRYYLADAGFAFGASRQALAFLLSTAGIGEGDEVVLADFNCSTVLDSIESVGASGRFVDIHDDWTYDCGQLEEACAAPRVKALVITHFFGKSAWTPSLGMLVRSLRARGLLIIEDCAHSMMDGEQPAIGTQGDAALFSVGNDKPIAAGKCGVLLVRGEPLAGAVARRYGSLPERSAEVERLQAVWNLVYWALTAPEVCHPGIVSVLPRVSVFPTEAEYAELVGVFSRTPTVETLARFPSAADLIANAGVPGTPAPCTPLRAGPLQERLLSATLAEGSLARANVRRSENLRALDEGRGVDTGRGARLRYTIAFPEADAARQVAAKAVASGIEAGCFNWDPLLSVGKGIVRELPAWAVRPECVVNFPVHMGVEADEIAVIVSAMAEGGGNVA